MQYINQKELKEMILRSYEKIERKKEEINKINVFPVPDQDTGTNMAKTLLGIKKAVEKKEFKDLDEFSNIVLEAVLEAAQGNAGVIYTGFLAEFLPALENKNPIGVEKLALAFEKGSQRARKSILNPKEGTILDVIDAVSLAFKNESKKEKDIINVFKVATEKAKDALLATREKLEILRKANVVDAGGLSFLMIMESYLDVLAGERKIEKAKERPSERVKKFIQILANRYEVVALIKNPRFDEKAVKEKLEKLGDCIDIVQIKNKMKLHIHTDFPDDVKDTIRTIGQVLNIREQDMTKEVVGEPSIRKVSIGIVTEDINDIPEKILERYQIEIVKVIVEFPEEIKNLPGENIYQKMREAQKRGLKSSPKTSQATPKSYLDAYKKQLERFDQVLCLTISSKISGCYNSAIQAREMLKEPEKIFVLDSVHAAASEGLLVLRAIELIQEQRDISDIIDEIKKLIPKTHLYIILEDPRWLAGIGRITESQANWVRRIKKIGLHPVIQLKNGRLQKGGMVFAKDAAEGLFKKISKESRKERKEGKRIRVVIQHADNLEQAKTLKKLLKDINAEVQFISLGSPVICGAAGPGTMIAGWSPI